MQRTDSRLFRSDLPQRRARIRSRRWLAIAMAALTCGPIHVIRGAEPATIPDPALLGVRVLKAPTAGSIAWQVELPADCRQCRLLTTDRTSGQNRREIFFHVLVPPSRSERVPLHLKIDPRSVRQVLVGRTDYQLPDHAFARAEARADGVRSLDFRGLDDGITFNLPLHPRGISLPPDDLADVTELYTFIETPGVYIRVAHADPLRRRGAYATGPWPAIQASAALNLEFAAREAIKILHLDATLQAHGVLTIMLMNFDTNYPTLGPDTAHDDWPPHWHMHLYWKESPRVRKVGHFYITPDGLLGQNQSGDQKSWQPVVWRNQWYARGEPDETRTPDGELLYSQTITAEGYFELTAARGACRFIPISGGYNFGVRLSCNDGQIIRAVRANDHLAAADLQLYLDDHLVADYRYDPDTGALLHDDEHAP